MDGLNEHLQREAQMKMGAMSGGGRSRPQKAIDPDAETSGDIADLGVNIERV